MAPVSFVLLKLLAGSGEGRECMGLCFDALLLGEMAKRCIIVLECFL